MINNSALSSSMNVADLVPKAAPMAPARGDGAFGEALAGAHTVHDRRESLDTAARTRRDQVQNDRGSERTTGTSRTDATGSSAADRSARTDDSTHDRSDTRVDDATGSDRTAGTTGSSDVDETAGAADAAPVDDVAEDAPTTDGKAAALVVAAAPVKSTADATIVPTATPTTQSTDAVDAAIRMAITGSGEVAADVAVDAYADAATTAATTRVVTVDADVDADVDVDAKLAAATARGAEDAVDGDVKAGPTRPTTSVPTTTSGPSPVQLAAATFVDDAAGDAAPIEAATVKVAAPTAAVATDVATGEAPDATAQLVQAAAVDGDADVDPDAAADTAPIVAKATKDGAAVVTAKTEQVDVVDADAPEAMKAGKLNQQQAPTVAAAAQHQAAVQAKVAEKAAAQEGGDASAPVKLEPLPAHANAAVGQGEQVPTGIRVREGLLGAHQQQRIDHIAEQLSTRLRMSQAAGGTEVKLNLKPHELGEVSVKMNVREGVVAATVLVDKADTLRTMQANIDELKRSLESQGLTIQEFTVDVRGETGAGGANARAQADLNRSAARTASGSSSTVAGAAAVTPGLSGDRVVEADEIHDGDVSVLA
jgi:flagellar hook-length control protein FliK